MPINDFKPFAAGPGANVTSQADWENLPALLSGFMSGKASSAQMNKAFRQASFIAAALAQFVSEKTDQDVLDDGDLPGFVEKLTAGFAAQYLSRSNPFGDIASDGPDAIATALSNLGLGVAQSTGQSTASVMSQKATTDAINTAASVGVNQLWHDVTAVRTAGTSYTNDKGRPIVVTMNVKNIPSGLYASSITVQGIQFTAGGGGSGEHRLISVIVPPGQTYVYNPVATSNFIFLELY